MLISARSALLAGGLAASAFAFASTELTVLRTAVGVTGHPVQLSGTIDSNGNGRRELLVAGRWHVSLVEDDANPRGYRELARVDAPYLTQFDSATLIEAGNNPPALLLQWSDKLELRDLATLRIIASLNKQCSTPALGDVDGDGQPEIVVSNGWDVDLLDPATLQSRGSFTQALGHFVLANIVGDGRAELVSSDGRAYTVTRSGNAWSATETWNAGISGTWIPYAIDLDARKALVLHDSFGFSAQLATFHPTAALRTLVPADGPSFTPRFGDANGDGRVDIIIATSSKIRAIDIATGATIWERDTIYQPPYIGSAYMPVTTDLDGDGTLEMAWADASYDSGVVAISAPLSGAPRWHADWRQSFVTDWTLLRRADGSSTIAYLTQPTITGPRLGTVGFLDTLTLADEGGSAPAWLPGYTGIGPTKEQRAIAALTRDGQSDAVVVIGVELPLFSGTPIARWLWTFDDNGALLSERTVAISVDPFRLAAAQVLDRPERQLVVAGLVPGDNNGDSARVEVIDQASGNVLWQSALLPTYDGAPLRKLHVADIDADGRPEIVLAYGTSVAVLRPAGGNAAIAIHTAQTFSLLERGPLRGAKLATLNDTAVAVYDGTATVPEKTFVLPHSALSIVLFAQAPDDTLMFATSGYMAMEVRSYDNGQVVAQSTQSSNRHLSLTASDRDGDSRIDIIGNDPGFEVWRLDNDYIFSDQFD